MEKKTPGYGDAIAEIESILAKFEREDFDIDQLAAHVKRATELIKLCRGKLAKAEADVQQVLSEEKPAP